MDTKSSQRVVFLDWLRGVAAITMIQGHTFDAFTRPASRNGSAFIFSQFIGGEAAAVFLLLTGVTYALGMNRREELPAWRRVTAALRRARYLFILAVVFRVQNWIFDYPRSKMADLLKVDILNLMGATAFLLAVLALVSGINRVRWSVIAGVAIAGVSPLLSMIPAAGIPYGIRNYFIPNYDGFSIFPWGAFLAFGIAAGSVIPLIRRSDWNRIMQWNALLGFALLLSAQYFSNLPYSIYPHSDFWLNSPGLIFCKVGVAMLLGSAAFLWTEYFSTGWSFVRQLGTTSLVVYWVHVELEYGRLAADYRQTLGPFATFMVAVFMVVAMLGVSVALRRIPWYRLPIVGRWSEPSSTPSNVYTLPHRPDSEAAAGGSR